eukprot:TRINITY_DN5734_c1_g1_i1.p1 TRINITY_DN5734_c1_g1~~TRINITY_DN5734_c1_g1_i1.p1  ORF type:complete len:883 (+),score=335.50 TRINITY_DN5734_c1_g1_i1:430-3078(+)
MASAESGDQDWSKRLAEARNNYLAAKQPTDNAAADPDAKAEKAVPRFNIAAADSDHRARKLSSGTPRKQKAIHRKDAPPPEDEEEGGGTEIAAFQEKLRLARLHYMQTKGADGEGEGADSKPSGADEPLPPTPADATATATENGVDGKPSLSLDIPPASAETNAPGSPAFKSPRTAEERRAFLKKMGGGAKRKSADHNDDGDKSGDSADVNTDFRSKVQEARQRYAAKKATEDAAQAKEEAASPLERKVSISEAPPLPRSQSTSDDDGDWAAKLRNAREQFLKKKEAELKKANDDSDADSGTEAGLTPPTAASDRCPSAPITRRATLIQEKQVEVERHDSVEKDAWSKRMEEARARFFERKEKALLDSAETVKSKKEGKGKVRGGSLLAKGALKSGGLGGGNADASDGPTATKKSNGMTMLNLPGNTGSSGGGGGGGGESSGPGGMKVKTKGSSSQTVTVGGQVPALSMRINQAPQVVMPEPTISEAEMDEGRVRALTLLEKVKMLEDQAERLKMRNDDTGRLEKTNTELEARVADLQELLSDQLRLADAKEIVVFRDPDQMEQLRQRLNDRNVMMQAQLDSAMDELAEKNYEIKRKQRQVNNLEEDVEHLEEELDWQIKQTNKTKRAAKRSIHKLKDDKAQLKAENQVLETNLRTTHKEKILMKEKALMLQKEKMALEGDLEEEQTRSRIEKDKVKRKHAAEKEELIEEVDEARSKSRVLQKKVTKQTRKVKGLKMRVETTEKSLAREKVHSDNLVKTAAEQKRLFDAELKDADLKLKGERERSSLRARNLEDLERQMTALAQELNDVNDDNDEGKRKKKKLEKKLDDIQKKEAEARGQADRLRKALHNERRRSRRVERKLRQKLTAAQSLLNEDVHYQSE